MAEVRGERGLHLRTEELLLVLLLGFVAPAVEGVQRRAMAVPGVGSGSFLVIRLMMVYDFHILDPAFGPDETHAVVVIDANGMLAFAVALERL